MLFASPVIENSQHIFVDEGAGPTEWSFYDNLIDANADTAAYTTYTDENGALNIIFGDNVNGRIPSNGALLTATYRTGGGNVGNVGANMLKTIVLPLSNITAVNNNAAAVLLALAALASRKEVIVARGELVEIGGGFRIPDVLRRSGAKLVEVGTTNRTYTRDYAGAINEKTGAILRVHASNFKISGFVARAEGRDLAALAREHNVAFIHDLGSGTFLDTSRYGLGKELTIGEAVREGADVVTFSGDKLLGGPQAGIAVGRAERIVALRTHPLMRALRPDKLTIAALLATLETYRDGHPEEELPVWRMIAAPSRSLAARARTIAAKLDAAGITADVMEVRSTVGGGSLPEETQPSFAVAIGGDSATRIAQALRSAEPPIIARIVDEHVALDVRSVLPEDDEVLARAVIGALAKGGADGPTKHKNGPRAGAGRSV